MLRNDGIRRLGQSQVQTQTYESSSFSLQHMSNKSKTRQGKNNSDSDLFATMGTINEDQNEQVRKISGSVESHTSQSKIMKNTSVSWTYEQQEV